MSQKKTYPKPTHNENALMKDIRDIAGNFHLIASEFGEQYTAQESNFLGSLGVDEGEGWVSGLVFDLYDRAEKTGKYPLHHEVGALIEHYITADVIPYPKVRQDYMNELSGRFDELSKDRQEAIDMMREWDRSK